jgi:hypothetical protein
MLAFPTGRTPAPRRATAAVHRPRWGEMHRTWLQALVNGPLVDACTEHARVTAPHHDRREVVLRFATTLLSFTA